MVNFTMRREIKKRRIAEADCDILDELYGNILEDYYACSGNAGGAASRRQMSQQKEGASEISAGYVVDVDVDDNYDDDDGGGGGDDDNDDDDDDDNDHISGFTSPLAFLHASPLNITIKHHH